MSTEELPRNRASGRIGLALILLLALALRLRGIDFGLPNPWCSPDEGMLVKKSLAMGTGDLNPHFFNYPSFALYVLAGLYGAYFAVGRVFGLFDGLADFQRAFFVDASSFHLLGRILVAAVGAGSVVAVHRIARGLEGPRAGWIAAFFLAIAFLHVRDSHFLTLDVPATFLMLVGAVWLARYLARPEGRTLILCGAFLGLAASTKYNLGLFAFWAILAPWLIRDPELRPGDRTRHTILAGAAVGIAFLIASPFIVLDFATFRHDLLFERAHFATGHGDMAAPGWTYHLTFTLWHGLGWPLLAAAGAGCGVLALGRRPGGILLLAGILVYFGVASAGKTKFVRYMMPLVPLLSVAAGVAVARLTSRRPGIVAVAAAVVLATPSLHSDLRFDSLLARTDTRLHAAKWLETHVPTGSRIAMEGDLYGSPWVNRSRESLAEQLEDYQTAGRDPRRLVRMLALDGYPPEPNYYVLELHEPGNPPLRAERETYDLEELKKERVTWVVVQEHPLQHSRGDPEFRAALEREAHLEVRFDPFPEGGKDPIFDPFDAFYVPFARFDRASRPGPGILIYRLS